MKGVENRVDRDRAVETRLVGEHQQDTCIEKKQKRKL